MIKLYSLSAILVLLCVAGQANAQTTIKGKIIDGNTKEAIPGVVLHCTHSGCDCGCVSNAGGAFEIRCKDCCNKLLVSAIGYSPIEISTSDTYSLVALYPTTSQLQEVVLTASKGEAVKRSEAPKAISLLSNKTIQETKPTTADQVLNKVSGVNMVNLGN